MQSPYGDISNSAFTSSSIVPLFLNFHWISVFTFSFFITVLSHVHTRRLLFFLPQILSLWYQVVIASNNFLKCLKKKGKSPSNTTTTNLMFQTCVFPFSLLSDDDHVNVCMPVENIYYMKPVHDKTPCCNIYYMKPHLV